MGTYNLSRVQFVYKYLLWLAWTLPGLAPGQVRSDTTAAAGSSQAAPKRIEIAGIHNAFQVTDQVFSGSQPEGEEAFTALARLGMKTIVSVDGSKPDVESARRHGLRYIHLPFGYDTVPTNRVAELAKAAGMYGTPVFVHCHQGLHRGPAAVAIICQATQNWTTNRALAWMRQAGTAADYAGLYLAVATAQQPTPERLSAIRDLPEVAQISDLVEAMVSIDGHFSRLKLARKAGWKAPPGHADVSPEHEALILWEHFRELSRSTDTGKRPSDYGEQLAEARARSEALRAALSGAGAMQVAEDAFKQIERSCSGCHRRYRNQQRKRGRFAKALLKQRFK